MRTVDLSMQDCIFSHYKEKVFKFSSTSANTVCFSHEELCHHYSMILGSYPKIVNPDALILNPNPSITEYHGNPALVFGEKLEIKGKNVLIIGGAKNIGFALSQRLYREGANVTATSRFPECYKRTPYPLEKLDVRTDEEVSNYIDSYIRRNDQIDVLIILVGMFSFGRFQDYTGNDLLAAFNVLLIGHQRLVKYALPYMRHSNETRVISFGSAVAEFGFGFGGGGIYCMAKKAMQTWNTIMQTEEMYRKAFGETKYGPTFIIVEPYFVDSTIGMYEFFKPSEIPIDDPNSMGVHDVINLSQGGGKNHPPDFVAEAIINILQAPQPTIHYVLHKSGEKSKSLKILGINKDINAAEQMDIISKLNPTLKINFLNQYGASTVDAIKYAQQRDYDIFCSRYSNHL